MRVGWFDAAVLLYALYTLVRNVTVDGVQTVKYVTIALSIFYLTSILMAKMTSRLRYVVVTIVGLILATSIYGLIEYALQSNFIYDQYVSVIVQEPVSGLHRIGSSIAHPVPYGAFLLQALPFAVLLWAISRSRLERGLALASILTGILALFFTYSKGSWIVALIIAAGALLFSRGFKSRKMVVPALLIVVVVAVTTVVFWGDIQEEVEGRSFSSVTVQAACLARGGRRHPRPSSVRRWLAARRDRTCQICRSGLVPAMGPPPSGR